LIAARVMRSELIDGFSANPLISERDKRRSKEFYRFAWRQ
jgi:hypothetical protein